MSVKRVISNRNTKLPDSWERFIDAIDNKKYLKWFLSEELFQKATTSLNESQEMVIAEGFNDLEEVRSDLPFDET